MTLRIGIYLLDTNISLSIPKPKHINIIMKNLMTILCFLLYAGATSITSGQTASDDKPARLGKRQLLDRSYMECVYEHTVYDPYYESTEINDYILEIGKKASRYAFYEPYLVDSIIETDYPNGLSRREYYEISNRFTKLSMTEETKEFESNTLSHFESIFMDHYIYKEEIPVFKWTLTDSIDEVCGHQCKTATTTFRGRNWTAWYCEEIPVNNGPAKFSGLPGLILKVQDDKNEHIIEAMQVRKSDKEFGYKIRSFLIPTDRKTFNKMLNDYKMDVGTFLAGSQNLPKKADGSSPFGHKRLFYNPIEKE